MSNLKNRPKTIYLAGPMEYAANAGRNWRLRYKQEFAKLGYDCIIPEFEEKFVTDQAELNRLKLEDIEQYKHVMRELIRLDLNFVRTVGMVVVRWNGERMSGTIGEAQDAYLSKTPIFLVTPLPLEEVPGWFLACFERQFTSLKELTEHIKQNLKN